ncbi:FAD dependent oxidoreductase [Paenibacillus sp. UNCCL117]|uniref:FAD-dependent oxidoreductase n=1 Tax=unclassified Paenibacillus TaxID=185978 RepID=UPI0008880353|nr:MULTISPECIES: FAD-dependent oxidoreductase [unclassified Paenibacillus]SDD72004.1 FAD dependent oxidoreductase [Paenibacillus sp. cl123]SFW45642.1 FAD dependent oxidoreductase [Paenibacillus sp. UNCCL117]
MKRKGRRLSAILTISALILIAAIYVFANQTDQTKPGNSPDNNAITPQAVTTPGQKPAAPPPSEPKVPVEQVDVLVVGTELEGLYLARAAADEGLKVKVIDPRDAFGGQVLQGEMLFLDETRDDQYKLLVQGRAKSLFDGFRSGKIRKLQEFEAYFAELVKGIPIEQGIKIEGMEYQPGEFGQEQAGKPSAQQQVKSIRYVTKNGEKKKIEAAYWVENTDYAAFAGGLQAKRLPGLEAFYGQSNIEYMSAGMMMKFKNVDWAKFQKHFNELTKEERNAKYGYGSVDHNFAIGLSGMTNKYKATNDRVFLRGLNAVSQRDGEVIINAFLIYTVDPSDDVSVKAAMELGKKEIPLILEHFRKNIVGWEKAELNGFPNYLYIREYNHYETDYVLKPSDMLGAKMFWDNVSIGGYPLDLQGTSANKWGIEMGRPDKYGMPLRSFLLKGYDNVILAGKNVGASAIAYGSARIQPNTSLAAESIGVILGQIQGKKKLRELKEADMPALHQYLQTKYAIKLTGVTGNNKLAGWTADELAKLDTGEIVYASYVKTRKK